MSNMVVRTNIYAQNAHRNMKNVGLQQKQASNRLSSGYRINSAADDAAGLAISETMRAQIRGLDQASRNAQDGQAMLLTTEGGLEEIGNMLQRTRELLVQASNDTNTQSQRDMIQQEIQQLGREINGMQSRVEFNTNQVLNMGSAATEDRTDYVGTKADVESAGDDLAAGFVALSEAQAALDGAMGAAAISTARADLSLARQSVANLRSALDTALADMVTEDKAYRTAVEDLDINDTSEKYIAWFQAGANSGQGIQFDFETVRRAIDKAALQVNHIGEAIAPKGTEKLSGIGFGKDISGMISSIQNAIDGINSTRANLGAVQNRMDYTMRSLDISSENLSDSESRVRNADVAKEMMKFTMSNVLQQAAVSMLSQANQMPNNLLQLLR